MRSGNFLPVYAWNAGVAACAGDAWTRMHSWKMSHPWTMGLVPQLSNALVPLMAMVATLRLTPVIFGSNAARTAASVVRSGVMMTSSGASCFAAGRVAEFSVLEIDAPGWRLSAARKWCADEHSNQTVY